VRRALDELPLEYVVDEVVRRVAGTGTGNVTLLYRDGFVVNRSIVHSKPSEAVSGASASRIEHGCAPTKSRGKAGDQRAPNRVAVWRRCLAQGASGARLMRGAPHSFRPGVRLLMTVGGAFPTF
jgi:hypothetical protein